METHTALTGPVNTTSIEILASRAASDMFQLNERKFKEMRICFSRSGTLDLNPIVINDKQIDVVSHAKILGVDISSDLKWIHHVSERSVFYDVLPVCQEALQKRARRIIFPCFMYDEALVKASLVALSDRRQALTDKLFKKILDNRDNKLRNLLSAPTKC